MKSKFITDPQDPSDSFLDTAGAEIYANFSPPAGQASGKPPASAPLKFRRLRPLPAKLSLPRAPRVAPLPPSP